MSVELTMLFWAAALAFVQMVVAMLLAITDVGVPALAGNRDGVVQTGMAARAKRAHTNMLENLLLFAVLVLIIQVAGLNDATTILGAQIFVVARLAYAIIYVIGVPWLRSIIWVIGTVGLVMVAWPILAG